MRNARPAVIALQEVFGLTISDAEALRASTPATMAGHLSDWFLRVGLLDHLVVAGTFVRLRRLVATEFELPKKSIGPATPWKQILSGYPTGFCRSKWTQLRRQCKGLPRLKGPRWLSVAIDLAFIPVAPLLYLAVGGGLVGGVWALGVVIVAGGGILALSRLSATTPPHCTVMDSAKYIAIGAGRSPASGDRDWVQRETADIVIDVLECELDGRKLDANESFDVLGLKVVSLQG